MPGWWSDAECAVLFAAGLRLLHETKNFLLLEVAGCDRPRASSNRLRMITVLVR